MADVLIATDDEPTRRSLSDTLLSQGFSLMYAASWERMLELLVRPQTRLVLLDARAGHLLGGPEQGALLDAVVSSIPHKPRVVVVSGEAPPFPEVAAGPGPLKRLASRHASVALSKDEIRQLRHLGLGSHPLRAMAKLACSQVPVCIHGELGTGKKRVARALHRLGGGGRFNAATVTHGDVSVQPDGLEGGNGGNTTYLSIQGAWPAERVAVVQDEVTRSGGRLLVGTREPPPAAFGQWAHLHLPPVRERPKELRPLVLYYLEIHRQRLGLPSRRFGRNLWSLVRAWRWPGNVREVESFVATVLSSVDKALIHAEDLPAPVRNMVDPPAELPLVMEAASFEALAEEGLKRVVELYDPAQDTGLQGLVLDSVRRPLIRLVLAKTGGNRRQTAHVLGVSRNTLSGYIARLNIEGA